MYDHTSLEAWQGARRVAVGVLNASKVHWKPRASALFSQLQRCSLSVQLNIAEGWTFNRSATYTRYLGIAYGSAVETGELLGLALTTGALPTEVATLLLQDCKRTQRLLVGLLKRHRPMA